MKEQMTSLGLNVPLMVKKHQKALVRILVLALLFTGTGTLVLWDHYRVNRDFLGLKALLSNVRYEAITNNKILIARFIDRDVVVTDKDRGKVTKRPNIPTLNKVNYNTTAAITWLFFVGVERCRSSYKNT